jgi:SAM-dependent methyltransferase
MAHTTTLDGLIRCTRCGQALWIRDSAEARCRHCGLALSVADGVLLLPNTRSSEPTEYYGAIGGTRFVGSSFASNMQIHFSTRAYCRYLGAFFSAPRGALLDLGCGDGRIALWALEHGFERVVALDSSRAALARLAAEADRRGLSGLIPICAAYEDDCLAPAAFEAIFAIEALTYLGASYAMGLGILRRAVAPEGRVVLAEFCRHGRLLSDVIALNVENMAKVADESARWEKNAEHRLVQRLFEPDELAELCERSGFTVLERRGISPIPMLFQYVYGLTSYPLRPPLDADLERVVATLDEQTSNLCELSRNVVLLLTPGR